MDHWPRCTVAVTGDTALGAGVVDCGLCVCGLGAPPRTTAGATCDESGAALLQPPSVNVVASSARHALDTITPLTSQPTTRGPQLLFDISHQLHRTAVSDKAPRKQFPRFYKFRTISIKLRSCVSSKETNQQDHAFLRRTQNPRRFRQEAFAVIARRRSDYARDRAHQHDTKLNFGPVR